MKKIRFLLCAIILLSVAFISCKQITETTEEITQVNYIVPVWKGSLPTAPSNPEVGWAYYNTTAKKSFIYDGSEWQIMSQDGTDGTGITWKGELATAPANPKLNWAYYNTIDGNSYIYNGSSWDYLAKSGRDGASGILLWLGSYDFEPENPSDGWAYYNTNDGISYIYSNGTWQTLSKDGANGTDGTSIVWKGVLSIAPEFPEVNWAYFNSSEQVSYIWNGANWDTLAVSLGGDTTVTVGIIWLGTFDSAPLSPLIGYAYYNSTAGASYVYDGSVWQQISKDGIAGTNGTNGTVTTVTGYLITWKGSFSTAPSNPKAGWAYYNTSAKKSYIYDGSSWQIMAQDGADSANGSSSGGTSTNDSLVFVSESTETIDGVTYNVKSYADVYAAEPYFYTYYKYYYLNSKLRRTKLFYHSVGSDLDYKYNEFVEHTCGSSTGLSYEYIYRENGKLESYIQITNSTGIIYKYEYNYETDGTKLSQKLYVNGNLNTETIYYSNGKIKIQKSYNTSSLPVKLQTETTYYETGIMKESKSYNVNVSPSYLYYKRTYYENGKEEYTINYSPEDIETSKNYYTYFENGNKKTYDSWRNEILDDSYTYYDNASTTVKSYLDYNYSTGIISAEKYNYSDGTMQLYIRYNSDSTIDSFDYQYTSGYTQYYYTDSGYFYTYEDGKTTSTSTSTSYYATKTAYTEEQAVSKVAELKSSF